MPTSEAFQISESTGSGIFDRLMLHGYFNGCGLRLGQDSSMTFEVDTEIFIMTKVSWKYLNIDITVIIPKDLLFRCSSNPIK